MYVMTKCVCTLYPSSVGVHFSRIARQIIECFEFRYTCSIPFFAAAFFVSVLFVGFGYICIIFASQIDIVAQCQSKVLSLCVYTFSFVLISSCLVWHTCCPPCYSFIDLSDYHNLLAPFLPIKSNKLKKIKNIKRR